MSTLEEYTHLFVIVSIYPRSTIGLGSSWIGPYSIFSERPIMIGTSIWSYSERYVYHTDSAEKYQQRCEGTLWVVIIKDQLSTYRFHQSNSYDRSTSRIPSEIITNRVLGIIRLFRNLYSLGDIEGDDAIFSWRSFRRVLSSDSTQSPYGHWKSN